MGIYVHYIQAVRFSEYLCYLFLQVDIIDTELKLSISAIRWYQLYNCL